MCDVEEFAGRPVSIMTYQPLKLGNGRAGGDGEGDARETTRDATIERARRAYRDEGTRTVLITSERGWINEELRGNGLPPLNEEEIARFSIRSDVPRQQFSTVAARAVDHPFSTIGASDPTRASRTALIASSHQAFERERGRGKTILCSVRSWINQAFRDSNRALPTVAELAAAGVPIEAEYPTFGDEED